MSLPNRIFSRFDAPWLFTYVFDSRSDPMLEHFIGDFIMQRNLCAILSSSVNLHVNYTSRNID